MRFFSSTSGRACLSDWDQPLSVDGVLSLLLAIKRAAATAGTPVILLVLVREAAPVPTGFLLNCLQGTLPAILDCCEQLALVVEGTGSERVAFGAALWTTARSARRRTRTQIFESLSTAFAYTQRFAPQDVIELQRRPLRQRPKPNGHSTWFKTRIRLASS